MEDLNLERLEKTLIIKALNKYPTKREAHLALGISENTLSKKMGYYNIEIIDDKCREYGELVIAE